MKIADLSRAHDWRNVRVALSWNAQFPDLRDYMGVAWYRTTFTKPDVSDGRHALLLFAAVDYYCEIYLNGKQVGAHEGGYTPFRFDVTDSLQPGKNELVLRVVDPPMDEKANRLTFPEMLYNEIPHGKQNWYVQTGGIWQSVRLKICPRDCIDQVQVTAKTDGRISIQVRLANRGRFAEPDATEVIVRNPKGGVEFRSSKNELPPGPTTFEGMVKSPQLWSPDHPALYTLEVRNASDSFSDHFGFRSFEAREGMLYLNGKPFYMIAALDQDFYPETIYTPPSKDYVRDEMLKAKRLGLNLLRCHIKVCDPTYLAAADEVGMLVWYEIPSWNDFNHFSPKAAERGEKTFAEMVERDWNHPSIVIQSLINEGWGTNLPEQAESRQWLRGAFDRAKKLIAPLERLIVDNSACCNNFHLKTDIEDNHRYNSIPDEYQRFDSWVTEFAARPKWNFSPHGDAEPSGREPLILSEFGNWGLPRLPKALPWWFERDFAGRAVTRPGGLFERFSGYGFGKLFRDYDELATATQWHQFISLKHEIEEIRSHASIQGYVITEFTDINWEANGLLSIWREPKIYAAELAKLQQPDVVLARLPKHNFTAGERVEIETMFSHYGVGTETGLNSVTLKWSTSWKMQGTFAKKLTTARGSIEPLNTLALTLPPVSSPQRFGLTLQLLSDSNRLLAENSYEFFVYPKPKVIGNVLLWFHDPAKNQRPLAAALSNAGYQLREFTSDSTAGLLIATVLDQPVTQYVRAGGRAIILADSKDALPPDTSFKVTPRSGSDFDGNWVTNFNWIRTASPSPFSRLAFTKLLGFESAHVVPRFLIQGVNQANYGDVLSGIFYGWLNNNEALAVQLRAGDGKLLIVTYNFGEYGRDPYATHLLEAMITYVSGPNFVPRTEYRGSPK